MHKRCDACKETHPRYVTIDAVSICEPCARAFGRLAAAPDAVQEVPNAVAPESVEGSGGATTPRERAIEALHREVLSTDQHGCERNCAEVAVDAIEGAGLTIGDSAALTETRARLREAAEILAHHGDPNDPHCTQDGNQALRAVHAALGAMGESPAREGPANRCPECRTTEGFHKLDCSRGPRRYTGPAKGLKCPECNGEGRVFSIDASSYDDRDCSRCRGTGKG